MASALSEKVCNVKKRPFLCESLVSISASQFQQIHAFVYAWYRVYVPICNIELLPVLETKARKPFFWRKKTLDAASSVWHNSKTRHKIFLLSVSSNCRANETDGREADWNGVGSATDNSVWRFPVSTRPRWLSHMDSKSDIIIVESFWNRRNASYILPFLRQSCRNRSFSLIFPSSCFRICNFFLILSSEAASTPPLSFARLIESKGCSLNAADPALC